MPQAEPDFFNIGLLHTSLNGREGHEPYAPCEIGDLRSKEYDYWALGHVHKREIVSDDPAIVFPGNPQGRNFRECGTKSCSLVTVNSGKVEIIEKPTDVARWHTLEIDVSDSLSFDDVLNRIAERLEAEAQKLGSRISVFRVVVVGECKVHGTLKRDADKLEWSKLNFYS